LDALLALAFNTNREGPPYRIRKRRDSVIHIYVELTTSKKSKPPNIIVFIDGGSSELSGRIFQNGGFRHQNDIGQAIGPRVGKLRENGGDAFENFEK